MYLKSLQTPLKNIKEIYILKTKDMVKLLDFGGKGDQELYSLLSGSLSEKMAEETLSTKSSVLIECRLKES